MVRKLGNHGEDLRSVPNNYSSISWGSIVLFGFLCPPSMHVVYSHTSQKNPRTPKTKIGDILVGNLKIYMEKAFPVLHVNPVEGDIERGDIVLFVFLLNIYIWKYLKKSFKIINQTKIDVLLRSFNKAWIFLQLLNAIYFISLVQKKKLLPVL